MQSQVVYGEAGRWYVMHSGREINVNNYSLKPRKTEKRKRDIKGGKGQPE